MKKIVHFVTVIISVLSGLVLFLSIPKLFAVNGDQPIFGLEPFFKAFKQNTFQLISPDFTSVIKQWSTTSIGQRYYYTLRLIGISIAVTVIAGLFLSSIYILSAKRFRVKVKKLIDLSEAIPDLIVIFVIQFAVILLYKETGFKFLRLYGLSEQPYLIHVMTASFLPGLFMAQFLIKQVDEEFEKDYVILAKSKGIGDVVIYFRHILRNIVPLTIIQIRTLIWLIISNIVLIEYIFVLNGFTQDLSKIYRVDTMTAVIHCIMIAIPIILLDLLIKATAVFYRGKEDMVV
jgi:peptide/nickel transport system permease protein